MPRCLLGIGANLGDPASQIHEAVRRLSGHPRIELVALSGNWPTRPVGGPSGQPPFLNAAALIETDVPPESLLAVLQTIERDLGRVRSVPWEARPIDLDILLYGEQVVRQPELRIPHPWLVARRFVVGPAAEIAPELQHPLLGWSLARLWHHLQWAPPRVALVGCPTGLARQVATASGALLIPDAPRPPADASLVPDVDQQLELLRRRVERLVQSGWNDAQSAEPLLSAFWIDESLVRARATLPVSDVARWESEFARLESATAPPKLVVVTSGLLRAQSPFAADGTERYLADLMRQASERGTSPLVEVETTARDDVVREVTGAIVAMQ